MPFTVLLMSINMVVNVINNVGNVINNVMQKKHNKMRLFVMQNIENYCKVLLLMSCQVLLNCIEMALMSNDKIFFVAILIT